MVYFDVIIIQQRREINISLQQHSKLLVCITILRLCYIIHFMIKHIFISSIKENSFEQKLYVYKI